MCSGRQGDLLDWMMEENFFRSDPSGEEGRERYDMDQGLLGILGWAC